MDIGSTIKYLRKKSGLKQSELAEKAGISRVSIGNYERGDRIPNAEILLKISEALDVTVAQLMGFENKGVSDLSMEEFNRLSKIADEAHTHMGYIMGKTKEKNFNKVYLQELINELDFEQFENGISIYSEGFKEAILRLWSEYLSMMVKWLWEDETIRGEDLDMLYFSNKTSELFCNFRNLIFSFGKIFPDRKNSNGEFIMDALDIHLVHKEKSKMLESISEMLDTLIGRYLGSSLNADAILYADYILKDYDDEL